MAGTKVLLAVDGAIATVTLNNPERHNALSGDVVAELRTVASQLAVRQDVRAVILHGGDAKAFCSGADLKERINMVDEADVFATVHALREMVNLYQRLPMPVIAAIHGIAFGGGCELALACDLRVMSEEAQIGLTEVSLAIVPGGGGLARLPALVGQAVAREMIFTARRLTSREALECGLVNRVVPRERLLETARELALQIAANGPLAVRAAKRALNGMAGTPEALALEWEAYQSILHTEDRQEGLRAFSAKRQPVYRGE